MKIGILSVWKYHFSLFLFALNKNTIMFSMQYDIPWGSKYLYSLLHRNIHTLYYMLYWPNNKCKCCVPLNGFCTTTKITFRLTPVQVVFYTICVNAVFFIFNQCFLSLSVPGCYAAMVTFLFGIRWVWKYYKRTSCTF